MLPAFARTTVVVLTPVMASDHGTTRPDWSQVPATRTVAGCSWQPGAAQSDDNNRIGVQAQGQLFMPAGAQIDPLEHVRINGDDFEIVGEPERWEIGTGSVDHVVVHLNRWEG